MFKYKLCTGLLFGLRESIVYKYVRYILPWRIPIRCIVASTVPKSCINVERLCELGVGLDTEVRKKYGETEVIQYMDGLITKREILDSDVRSLFATLNSSTLNGLKEFLLLISG